MKVCQRLELFGRELIAVDGTRIKAVNNRDRNFTEVQLSLTDPNARVMHSGTGVGVGYSVQIAVATKHKLIAEQPVHSQISDLGLLAETARAARTSLGVERIEAVAGKGYFKGEDIAGCEAAGITPYVAKPRRRRGTQQPAAPRSSRRGATTSRSHKAVPPLDPEPGAVSRPLRSNPFEIIDSSSCARDPW